MRIRAKTVTKTVPMPAKQKETGVARVHPVQSPPQSVPMKSNPPPWRVEEVYAPEEPSLPLQHAVEVYAPQELGEEQEAQAQAVPVMEVVEAEPPQAAEPPQSAEPIVLSGAQEQPEIMQVPESTVEQPVIAEPAPAPSAVAPPIPPEQPTQTTCPGRPYTVRRGDSFQLIARRFGVSMRALLEANPELQPGRLMVGDVLCIPERGEGAQPSRPAPAATPPAPVPAQESDRHRIAEGESVADILITRDISLSAFQALNPRLRLGFQRVGDWVRLPPRGARGACGQGAVQCIEVDESLGALARRLNVNVGALLRANPNLLPSDFRAGQVICVPK